MQILLVVDKTEKWPLAPDGVRVVSARDYISSPEFIEMRRTRVYNVCGSYSYQSLGYYVSLLAEARGHKPVPDISTIRDMKSQTIIRFIGEDLDRNIQRDLSHIRSDSFILRIYFGRSVAKHYDKLSAKLFSLIRTPFFSARFVWQKNKWALNSLTPIAAKDIPEEHVPFIMERAKEYFSGKRGSGAKKGETRYDLAILHDPKEKYPPSNERAIKKFMKAANTLGFDVSLIKKEDYVRLAEFDALFIRTTTAVNHYTYRFAQRAAAEGLVVIDDPESILKCTNKVFLAELLWRHGVPAPKTMVLGKKNIKEVAAKVGLPCILKKPDSSFSEGVIKISDEAHLLRAAKEMLKESELLIAQKYTPTDFDWRVGIIDRRVIYVCRYYMVKGHWQIISHQEKRTLEGDADCVPVELVPEKVIKTALKAANLIGDGLYGVDLKQVGDKVYVIEVNDNPSIESGCEDLLLKDDIYREIMESFLRRVEEKKRGKTP